MFIIKWMKLQTFLSSLTLFLMPPPGLQVLFRGVIECRTMKFDTDSKKPKRIKCNHFLWSFNFSSFTIRFESVGSPNICRIIKYLKCSPANGDTGFFKDISGVWALPFHTADIWAKNFGNYVIQGEVKIFTGQTFFISSILDTLIKY